MSGPRTVTGQVRVLDAVEHAGTTLYVRVEDVSRIDAAAELVAETAIAIDRPLAPDERVPFSITVDGIREAASYAVRAHLDTTGTRRVEPGDLVTTQSYPVFTGDDAVEPMIVAHRV